MSFLLQLGVVERLSPAKAGLKKIKDYHYSVMISVRLTQKGLECGKGELKKMGVSRAY